MSRIYMQFGYSEPTYYMPNVYAALRDCRRADWLVAAWLETSRSSNMDDYNYNKIPGVALSGENLASLLKWMCTQGNKARREGRLALQPHLACGETARTNLKKFAPTTTTTTTTVPDRTPRQATIGEIYLEVRSFGDGYCRINNCGPFSPKRVDAYGSEDHYVRVIDVYPNLVENNNPITKICLRLGGQPYYGNDYEVPAIRGRDCYEKKSGDWSFVFVFDETEIEYSPLKKDCPQAPLGAPYPVCKTLDFSLLVITELLEPVQAPFNIYIVHTASGLQFWTRKPLS
jgi:hypothetical protein